MKIEFVGEKHHTMSLVDEWMIMEYWWNDTDRGNWSTGRKTLYNVGLIDWISMELWWNETDRGSFSTVRNTSYSFGGRWKNEYGELLEWYFQGELKYWEKNIIMLRW